MEQNKRQTRRHQRYRRSCSPQILFGPRKSDCCNGSRRDAPRVYFIGISYFCDSRGHRPGITNRPSYAALVSSVDSNVAKYIATLRVQISRQELISDLKEMTTVRCSASNFRLRLTGYMQHLLTKYMAYRQFVEKANQSNKAPKRLIFYRGLSCNTCIIYVWLSADLRRRLRRPIPTGS